MSDTIGQYRYTGFKVMTEKDYWDAYEELRAQLAQAENEARVLRQDLANRGTQLAQVQREAGAMRRALEAPAFQRPSPEEIARVLSGDAGRKGVLEGLLRSCLPGETSQVSAGTAVSFLLSVDPGLSKGVGLALFEDRPQGSLVAACFLPGASQTTLRAYLDTAMRAALWVESIRGKIPVTRVAVEWPQVLLRRRNVNPKWLLDLAAVDCFICAQFPGARLERYLPSDWKGTAKASKGTVAEKALDATRKRIERRLTPDEHSRIVLPAPSLQDNVFEAVGIGLKAVGRFEPVRVIAR